MKKRKIRLNKILPSAILLIFIFFPYIKMEDGYHTVIYLLKELKAADIQQFIAANQIATDNPEFLKVNLLVQIYGMFMLAVLSVARIGFSYFSERESTIYRFFYFLFSLVVLYLHVGGYGMREISGSIRTLVFPAIPFVWGCLVLLVERLMEELRLNKANEKK